MFTYFWFGKQGSCSFLQPRLPFPATPYAASQYTLTPVQYGMQLKTPDGQVVFEYMTKKPEGIGITSPSVACFHPVNTPSGERITNIAPNDHPHHRGIWFGFMDSEFQVPNDFRKLRPLIQCMGSRSNGVTFGHGESMHPVKAGSFRRAT